MTFSTSLVAVWYSSDSCRSAVRWLHCAIRLGAADRDHRLLGEGLQQFNLAVGEAAALAAAKSERPDDARHHASTGSTSDDFAVMPRMAGFSPGSAVQITDVDDLTVHDRTAYGPFARWRHRVHRFDRFRVPTGRR